jgi:hypothetical protein
LRLMRSLFGCHYGLRSALHSMSDIEPTDAFTGVAEPLVEDHFQAE